MSGGEEKTEQPSEHKLKEARKKGRVAKSTDVVAFFSLASALLALFIFVTFFSRKSIELMSLLGFGFKNIDISLIYSSSSQALDTWFILSLPALLFAGIGSFIGNVIQFGFLFSTHPLKLDLKRLDPVSGFKRLFSKNKLVEFIKQLVKFTAVFLVIIFTVMSQIRNIIFLFRTDLSYALSSLAKLVFVLIVKVLLCFLLIAVADFFWQRFSFLKSMRMSKYEVKKEYKQQEGDPHIKSERKRIHQEAVEGMSVNNVESASVVITNPSHIAVALSYQENIHDAPVVCAKGSESRAKEIITLAHKHSVIVLRNVPLARDLHCFDINEEIPPELYDSVAEVLTFVMELNNANKDNS